MAISQIVTNSIASGQTITSPTLASPTINGTYTAGTSLITTGTSQASTSGTSITFSSIPSWVKRITIMYQGVSTTGTSSIIVQVGAGSVTTSGYVGGASLGGTPSFNSIGFITAVIPNAVALLSGVITLVSFGNNTWNEAGNVQAAATYNCVVSAGYVTLSGTLDRVVITTVNGTDTFDAGSINILYE